MGFCSKSVRQTLIFFVCTAYHELPVELLLKTGTIDS